MSRILEVAYLAVTSLLCHVLNYVIDPHTVIVNVVIASLVWAYCISEQDKDYRLIYLVIAQELMVYGLWLTVSHGLRSVFAIWICLTIYDTIVRPKIVLHSSPVLITGL